MASHQGSAKSNENHISSSLLRSMTRAMLWIRRFEEEVSRLYSAGYIGGFCHLYIGQEAVVTGVHSCLNDHDDQMITGYRDHGHALACGMDPESILAELMGKEGGCSGGKGGSMHIFSPENHFYGGHGVVGAQVSIGTGIALANKIAKKKKVCVVFFGDGATNQGQVYESMNMAALWKLPVVYVIENNHYSMGTSLERSTVQTDLSRRGDIFDIPGKKVDGMKVWDVREATLKALEWARAGKGPYLLEMCTYRFRGHSMSDPGRYRSRDEVDTFRHQHDPIEIAFQKLFQQKWATEDERKAWDKDYRQKIKNLEKKSKRFSQARSYPFHEKCLD